MDFRLISKILGLVLALVAVAMACCGVFAKLDPGAREGEAGSTLLLSALITGVIGGLAILPGLRKTGNGKIPNREALVIVGLGWILSSVFGALPYLLCPPYMGPAGAFFESSSGFTTTGSSVMTVIEDWPRGILLWRATTQLLGGIGILVLFIALLSYIGVSSKSLFNSESSFRNGDLGLARIEDTALSLLRIYLSLVTACLLGLRAMGLSWFNSICHAFTTVSTAGLSPHTESIGHYAQWGNSWLIELWLICFMLLGSINFLFFIVLLHRHWKRVFSEEEAWWFLGSCALVVLLITAGRSYNEGLPVLASLRESAFTVVSIATTTGYTTVDYDLWPTWSKVLLLCLMLMGGCAGSTASGFKVRRVIVFVKSAHNEIIKTFRPSQVFRVLVNGNSIDSDARSRTMFFIALYLMLAIAATALVGFFEAGTGISMESCAAMVVATMFNIGPGFAAVGPSGDFSELRSVTKVFLGGLMILGRLELFALLALLLPVLWKKY